MFWVELDLVQLHFCGSNVQRWVWLYDLAPLITLKLHLERGSWTLRSSTQLNEPALGTMKHLMVASRTRIQADVVATGSRWRCLQFLSFELVNKQALKR